jgi:hypothetical protein
LALISSTEIIRRLRKKAFDNTLLTASKKMEVQTLRYSIFESEVLFTIDHRNIQALLTTQFEDFDLGLRREIHSSLRHNGAWRHSRSLLRLQFQWSQFTNFTLNEKHVQNLM